MPVVLRAHLGHFPITLANLWDFPRITGSPSIYTNIYPECPDQSSHVETGEELSTLKGRELSRPGDWMQ